MALFLPILNTRWGSCTTFLLEKPFLDSSVLPSSFFRCILDECLVACYNFKVIDSYVPFFFSFNKPPFQVSVFLISLVGHAYARLLSLSLFVSCFFFQNISFQNLSNYGNPTSRCTGSLLFCTSVVWIYWILCLGWLTHWVDFVFYSFGDLWWLGVDWGASKDQMFV